MPGCTWRVNHLLGSIHRRVRIAISRRIRLGRPIRSAASSAASSSGGAEELASGSQVRHLRQVLPHGAAQPPRRRSRRQQPLHRMPAGGRQRRRRRYPWRGLCRRRKAADRGLDGQRLRNARRPRRRDAAVAVGKRRCREHRRRAFEQDRRRPRLRRAHCRGRGRAAARGARPRGRRGAQGTRGRGGGGGR